MALFLGLVVAVSLFRLPFGSIGERVQREIIEGAQRSGVPVRIEQTSFTFPPALWMDQVIADIKFGSVELPIEITDISIRPALLRYFLLENSIRTSFAAYGGKGEIQYISSLVSPTLRLNTELKNLELANHKALRDYQLNGKISFKGSSRLTYDAIGRTIIDDATAYASINDLDYAGGNLLFGILPLPPVHGGALDASVIQEGPFLRIKELSMTSSIGSISGAGNLAITSEGKLSGVQINLTLKLTNDGRKAFATPLALFAGEPTTPERPEWFVTIRGTIDRPTVVARSTTPREGR